MRTVSVIPARGGSKGIHRKNLYPIAGKPLLEYTIDASMKSAVDEVWVATEDKQIKDFALSKGIRVANLPKELTTDFSSIDEVLSHFLKLEIFDILVLVQATSPLVRADDISAAVISFKENLDRLDSMISVVNTDDILIWDFREGKALNYDPLNRGRRQTRKSRYLIETGAFFITTRKQLISSRCRMGKKVGFFEVPYWTHFQVDSIEDAKMIERLMGGE